MVELHSPDGVAVLQFDIGPMVRFLARTRPKTVKRPAPTAPASTPPTAPATRA